ncbi:MAG: EamA family transporter RarD [Saccharospirillum sp.]
MKTQSPEAVKGVIYGLSSYGIWGCFPLFFSLFQGVPAWEVLIHRVIWSCVFLAVVITVLRRWQGIKAALAEPAKLGRVLACAVLIAVNWVTFIYAVESNQVLQSSLGYFLTPLINVAMGMVVLKETISRAQGLAVAIATGAILLQLVTLGTVPYLALILAFSFGTYGLMRKQVALDGLSGLFVETLLLAPLGLLALFALSQMDLSHFTDSPRTTVLLMASGVLTAIPLLLFAGAARRLRLATVGFLMYINPSMQFLFALTVFGEPLTLVQLATFVLIWSSLALYSWSAWSGRTRLAA